MPAQGQLDVSGLDLSEDDLAELLHVDVEAWQAECPGIREYYAKFGDRAPKALLDELDALEQRLKSATG